MIESLSLIIFCNWIFFGKKTKKEFFLLLHFVKKPKILQSPSFFHHSLHHIILALENDHHYVIINVITKAFIIYPNGVSRQRIHVKSKIDNGPMCFLRASFEIWRVIMATIQIKIIANLASVPSGWTTCWSDCLPLLCIWTED